MKNVANKFASKKQHFFAKLKLVKDELTQHPVKGRNSGKINWKMLLLVQLRCNHQQLISCFLIKNFSTKKKGKKK